VTDGPPTRVLLLAELRIALFRARSAQAEIEFIGKAYRDGILTAQEVVEELDNHGWHGFLGPALMDKIRKACGADVG
jgi:hypothetical protein